MLLLFIYFSVMNRYDFTSIWSFKINKFLKKYQQNLNFVTVFFPQKPLLHGTMPAEISLTWKTSTKYGENTEHYLLLKAQGYKIIPSGNNTKERSSGFIINLLDIRFQWRIPSMSGKKADVSVVLCSICYFLYLISVIQNEDKILS